ncbi:hypothetical protein [Phytohabitans rumicis]
MDDERWLTAKAAERRARTTYRYRTDAAALRDAWRAATGERGWAPDEWWTPAVDAVTRSLTEGRAAGPAYAQLGRERAESGHGIRAALDDLAALHDGDPPSPAVRAVVEAWAGVALAPARVRFCPDPPTPAHLRARVAELYSHPHDGLALLVVHHHGWEAVAALLEAGARTPAAFPLDTQVARLAPGRLVALVRQDGAAPLRAALADQARIVALPADLPGATQLVEGWQTGHQ